VQCDACGKWRRLTPEAQAALQDDAPWYCSREDSRAGHEEGAAGAESACARPQSPLDEGEQEMGEFQTPLKKKKSASGEEKEAGPLQSDRRRALAPVLATAGTRL